MLVHITENPQWTLQIKIIGHWKDSTFESFTTDFVNGYLCRTTLHNSSSDKDENNVDGGTEETQDENIKESQK